MPSTRMGRRTAWSGAILASALLAADPPTAAAKNTSSPGHWAFPASGPADAAGRFQHEIPCLDGEDERGARPPTTRPTGCR